MKIIFLSLLVMSCGIFQKKDNPPQDTIQPLDQILEKAEDYKVWTAELENDQGVIPQFKCDSLLFQLLYEVATDGDLDVKLYQGEPGEWFRSTTHDCFYRDEDGEPVRNGSKTTISRDMFLGLFMWVWFHEDRQMAEDIISYGRNASPKWFMGDGLNFIEREGRTHLRPSIRATLYHLSDQLGGEDNAIGKAIPYTPVVNTGYRNHLMVTHTLLRGLMLDGVSDYELGVLKKVADKQPSNAYYSAVYHLFSDGDQSRAIEILQDESLFPNDRLPSGADRCSEYIFQRDDDRDDPDPDNDDWKPCKDGSNETHPGVELLWTVKVIQLSNN